jgi:hypothetical protein
MNERIKDLLEEAGFVSYGEDTGFYNIPAPAFLSRIDRFAKLIVEECLYIVEGEDDSSADTKSVRLAMIRMKKHFGVEE